MHLHVFTCLTPKEGLALFVGRLRGGSFSVSLFILVLLFEKMKILLTFFKQTECKYSPRLRTRERTWGK